VIKIFVASSISLFLSACTSSHKSRSAEVTLVEVEKLMLQKTTQLEVMKQFGRPSEKRMHKDRQFWDFEDPKTGVQRLSLEFDDSNKLIGVMWIPRISDPEHQLNNVFSRYPHVPFKPIAKKEIYHSIETETTYSNDRSMSIFVNDRTKSVQAISWFLPRQSTVSSQSDSENTN
jgi:hypothetical protein